MMKKKLKTALLVLAALLAIVLLVVWLNLNAIVKAGIEQMGPKLTGCRITVESVNLSPLTGAGTIRGLVVSNPEGYSAENALSLGEVRVKVTLGSLASDRIVVEDVYVEAPEIRYELGLGESNIGKIQKNLEASAQAPKEPEPAKAGKKVQIDHVLVKDGKIRLGAKLLGGNAVPIPLPDVEMKDIGKDSGGVSMAQAVSAFFGRLAGGIGDAVKKGAGSVTGTIGNLFK